MKRIFLFFFGFFIITCNSYASDIQLGDVHIDVLSSYASLYESEKWGSLITVYLFSKKLSDEQIISLDHRLQRPIKTILGFEPAMQINIGLIPGAKTGSFETLSSIVVIIDKSDTVPIPVKSTLPINFPIYDKQSPDRSITDGIKSFRCELIDRGSLSFFLKNEFLFPSDIKNIPNILTPGTKQLNFQWDFDISTELRKPPQ